jgi:dihydroflavonol-4-reductase
VKLVTGGTGLLGAHLVLKLLTDDKKVRILSHSERGKQNLRQIFSYYNANHLIDKLEFADGDVLDLFSIDDALKGVDTVYHSAAIVSFAPGEQDMMYKTNIEGTSNVVNSCLAADHKIRLVHISSVAALSKPSSGKTDEVSGGRQEPTNSAYATSKFGAEQEVWRGYEEGLDGFIVNPSVIIGPGNWKTDSSQIFSNIANGVRFYPSGCTGFVSVHDVVDAIMFLEKKACTKDSFVLNGADMMFYDFLCLTAKALSKRPPSVPLRKTAAVAGMYAEAILSFFSGRKRKLSYDLINALMEKNSFSSEKIEALGYKFRPIKEEVELTASLFKSGSIVIG